MKHTRTYDLRMYFEHGLAACPYAHSLMDSLYHWKKSDSSLRRISLTRAILNRFERNASRAQVSSFTYMNALFKRYTDVETWMRSFVEGRET